MRNPYGLLLAAFALLSISTFLAAAESENRKPSTDREAITHQRPKQPTCTDRVKACDIDLAAAKTTLQRTEAERDQAIRERDRARIPLEQALMERDEARKQRNEALMERNEARVQRRQTIMERDEAWMQRDRAITERDEARAQREQAISEREQARADIMSLMQQIEDFAKSIRIRQPRDR